MSNVLWAILFAATLPPNASYTVDPAGSTVKFTIVHKLHGVEGVTHDVEARAVVKEDGAVLTMARIPVASFRSGDGNRDEHMLEALDAGKFPFVVFKGVAKLGPGREVPPGSVDVEGELELHGVKSPLTVPVTLAVQPDGSVRVRGGFDVSLDQHHVERPSLLFVKIDDRCHIDLDLLMRGVG